jgi:hypothetical protein
MPKFLTLRRSGSFTVETEGPSHCGLADKQKIKYLVTVHCKAMPSLDERGFLFEQRLIDDFFQTYNGSIVADSCELLSIDCTKEIKERILDENPKLKIFSIEVQLSAKPYSASMTHTWVSKKV